ncbi:MAG: hypothetical protein HYV04_08715 [Deltaproteobacteria bacterium]|nr:hypothetical protein [Deltaproteobacteria bacterium]
MRLEPNPGADDGPEAEQVERLDGDELVARVIVQIPDPKRPDSELWKVHQRGPSEAQAGRGGSWILERSQRDGRERAPFERAARQRARFGRAQGREKALG